MTACCQGILRSFCVPCGRSDHLCGLGSGGFHLQGVHAGYLNGALSHWLQAPGQSMAPAVLSQNLPRLSVTWHIDNFSAFKDILETRKLFSK